MSRRFRHLLYRLRVSRAWLALAFRWGGNRMRCLGHGNRLVWTGARLEGVRIRITGQNNRIAIQHHSGLDQSVVFDIVGNNNVVIIGQGSHLCGTRFHIEGNGHSIAIGHHCHLRSVEFWMQDVECQINIGDNTTCEDGTHLAATESHSAINVGANCMFAQDIDIRTSDSHSVLDNDTGQRINPPRGVTVEEHVWIGAHSVVLKGVTIGSNSIVGTGSIVTKPVPPSSVVAGNPAVVRKSNVTWARQRL